MKIALADNNTLKFTRDLKEHWERNGHEVRYEMGASETLAQWADLYFIDCWDNNIHYLFNWYQEHPEALRPRIACRAIDWEVWQGLARDQRIINWVDYKFCIAPHIQDELRNHNDWGDLHMVKCGVNTEKFTLIDRPFGNKVIIPCNEIDWILKNVVEGLKIIGMAQKTFDRKYEVTIKGKWTGQAGASYFKAEIEDLVRKLNLAVEVIDYQVEDYNQFLEQFDYCVVPSLKEAYSYVTAECASKGIKPVINSWLGAEDLWPREWLYVTPDRAAMMLEPLTKEHREITRDWVIEHSNVKTMLAEYDKVLGT